MGFGIGILIIGANSYGGAYKLSDFHEAKIGGFFKNLSRTFLVFSCFLIRGPGWSPPPMGFGIGTFITGGNF